MFRRTGIDTKAGRAPKWLAQLALMATLVMGHSLLLMVPAWAGRPGLAPPPDMRLMDQNDIDLASHTYRVPGPGISVGVPGQGGLTWATYFDNGNWTTPGWQISLQYDANDTTHYVVTLFGRPESFIKNGSAYTPADNTGGTLAYDSGSGTYTYVRRDGTVVVFSTASFVCGLWCTPAIPSTITYPSGEKLTLTYRSYYYWYGLSSIRSNLGYQLKINYACSSPNTDPCYREIASVIAINNAFDYCDPGGNSCPSMAHSWSTLSYSYSSSGTCPNCSRTESITDATGHQWQAIIASSLSGGYYDASDKVVMPSGRTWELKAHYPQYTVPNQWTFDDGTDPAHPWTYLASADGSGNNVVDVTDPLGHVRKVVSVPGSGFPIRDTLDYGGLNLTKTYENDGAHITRVTQPEGNYTQWTYDIRGNITQVARVAKSGSGVANIIQAADFPASCDSVTAPSSNFRYCNEPTSVTDAGYGSAGTNVITYTYHAGSGNVETVTGPVVFNGRPTTANTYVQVHAWYKNSTTGAYVDGGPVWKPSTISKCLADAALWGSFNWGTGSWTATGTCASASQTNRIAYAYPAGNSGSATNALASSVTVGSGDGVLAATTATAYDIYSNVASVTNPLGAATVYFYDLARNRTGVIGPDPDGGGSLKNPATRTAYDSDGRISEVEQGTATGQSSLSGFVSLLQDTTGYATGYFAPRAKVTRSIGGTAASVTQYSYDLAYNLTCTAVREDAAKFGTLPASACTQSGGIRLDQITHNSYDGAGRLTSVQSGYGASPITEVTTTYTSNSKVATVTDGKGNKSQYTYDGDDRVIQLNFPSKTTPGTVSSTDYEQYTYAANGNRLTTRLRSGETATSGYDALGRLIQTSYSGGAMPSVYYGYDLLGDLLYARYGSPGGYGVTFTYDALRRKMTEVSTGSGFSRTVVSGYDLAGNRTRLTYPDGSYIQYTYDALNRMKQVQQNGPTVVAAYSYDDLGRETGITRGNGANTSMSYSTTSQNWSLAQGGAMNPAVTYALAYTPAGQINQRTITSSSSGYKYGVTTSGTNYCPNGLNQYAMVGGTGSACSGGAAYSYDARGNLTSTGSRTFSYNLANQLTAAGSTGVAYDPLGRLAQVTASGTTQYLYDGAMLVAEYDGSGTMLRRYVPGKGVDEPLMWYEGADLSSPHWLHTDNQGSVIAATDGAATATPYAYSVTGEPKGGWSSSAPAFRYTGQVAIPSAKLYFYKARMYDPALGRFLQTDPTGYQAGMNLYAYVGNDPVNGLDPMGLCEDGVTECVTVTPDRPPFSWEWNAWDKISSFIESLPKILPSIPPPNDAGRPSQGSGANSGDPCPDVPAGPPGADVNKNVAQAQQMFWLGWLNRVRPNGQWDYAHLNGQQYAGYGNFNYGATCFSFLSLAGCQRGAGAAAYVTSIWNVLNGGRWTAGPGNPFSPAYVNGLPDYGDQARQSENPSVVNGYRYAACHKHG